LVKKVGKPVIIEKPKECPQVLWNNFKKHIRSIVYPRYRKMYRNRIEIWLDEHPEDDEARAFLKERLLDIFHGQFYMKPTPPQVMRQAFYDDPSL
jgi:hypothetical protein